MPRQFQGDIKLDVRQSTADWPAFLANKAPEGAPNVLVVLYDDTGCAAWSTYGGHINMPTMDRLAANGLTYSQWHTTALCSPTRSTFLTGRNHHLNGFADLRVFDRLPRLQLAHPAGERHDGAPPARRRVVDVLGRQEPQRADRRVDGRRLEEEPLAQGYDRFYGFVGGETNNWYPSLAEDNHYIAQPYTPDEGYHLSKDLADQALRMLRDTKQTEPDKPWYLWFCRVPTTLRTTPRRSTSIATRGLRRGLPGVSREGAPADERA